MTTENDFQAALDANPEDWQTRLVFADWLDERNDPRAAGYRWLGTYMLVPYCSPNHERDRRGNWLYWNATAYKWAWARHDLSEQVGRAMIPGDVYDRVKHVHVGRTPGFTTGADTRRQIEDAVALAYGKTT